LSPSQQTDDFADIAKKPPAEMTFDVHNPDGSVKKQTFKNGANLADPVIETPLASVRPNDDFADIAKPAGSDPPPPAATDTGDWRDPLTRIEPHDYKSLLPKDGHYDASAYGKEGLKAVGNIGAAGLGVILRPVSTVEGILSTILRASPPGMAADVFRGKQTAGGEFAQSVIHQPLETAEQLVGQTAVLDAAGRVVGPATKKLMDTAKTAREKTVRGVSGTGPQATKELVKSTQEANATEVAKTAEKNAEQTAKRKEQVAQHGKKTIAAEAQDTAVQDAKDRKVALERGVEHLDPEIKTQLEATEDRVNAEANKKYNDLNAALDDKAAPQNLLASLVEDASEKIKGSNTEPTILKDMEKRMNGSDPLTYRDLQGYREELGRELRKGTLAGDVFNAYKGMQESITDAMEGIAKDNRKLPEFQAARKYYREYAETFIDRASPVRKALDATERGKTVGSFAGKDQSGIEQLAKFDPALARRINTVRGYAAEAKTTKPGTPAKQVSPLSPKPVEVKPDLKKVGPDEVRQAKADALQKRSDNIRNRGGTWANTFVILDAIRNAITGNIEGIGKDVAVRAIYGAGKTAIANYLERPDVVKFLTEPTAKDIAQIPPELRGDFPAIIAAAESKGIHVSPALVKAMIGAAVIKGPKTKQLEDLRDGQPVSAAQ
jgi:hypothetical protein